MSRRGRSRIDAKPALALFGRRPPARVDSPDIPASEKPAQKQTHAPQQFAAPFDLVVGHKNLRRRSPSFNKHR